MLIKFERRFTATDLDTGADVACSEILVRDTSLPPTLDSMVVLQFDSDLSARAYKVTHVLHHIDGRRAHEPVLYLMVDRED